MSMDRHDYREEKDEAPRGLNRRHPFYCGCYSCLDDRGEVDAARPGAVASEPEEEPRTCDYCGYPIDEDQGKYCSRSCADADVSDRG